MKICYSFASRQRPDKFFDALLDIEAMTDGTDHFVVAKLDDDDQTMKTEEVRNKLAFFEKGNSIDREMGYQ